MYLAGVSVRRVEDITEALWGTRVSPSTVSELNQKIYAHIDAWRNRPIEGEHPYVFLDGIWLKRAGAARWRTWRCWWRSAWAATATGRSWACAKGRRKTKRVGGTSCGT